MGRVKNRNFWESERMNNAEFMRYYNHLTELSISVFEWKNLPDTIDPRFLELMLFGEGMAVFFKDDVLGYLALRCMIGGTLDVYQIPEKREAYASNGYHESLNPENSVIIFNNMLHTNSRLDVEVYAKRLYKLDNIIDVNANAQKTPIFIQCEETQRLTMKNMYMQYDGGMPFIFGDKNLNPNALRVLKTDAPYVADRIYKLRTDIWNEALSYLGITNVNTQKKERLISSEVSSSQGGTIAARFSRLNARKQACEQINKMFGLNIDCDFRVLEPEELMDEIKKDEVNENE